MNTEGYLIGLDLGQSNDYTAIAVLAQRGVPIGSTSRAFHEVHYDVVHLDRWRGRSYNHVLPVVRTLGDHLLVVHHRELIAAGVYDGTSPAVTLLVDRTGVGRAVLDNLRAAGLDGIGITIHGGDAVTRDDGDVRVPKRDLVGTLQVLLQNQRLKIAEQLPLASVLSQELRNFRARISLGGHDSYGAGDDWREGNHDDLVLSVAMAAWYGECERDGMDFFERVRDYYQAQRSW